MPGLSLVPGHVMFLCISIHASGDANWKRQHTCMKATQRQSRLGTDMRSSSRRLCRCQTRISPSPHAANTSLYSCGKATSCTLLGGEVCSISACSFLLCRPSPFCVLHHVLYSTTVMHIHQTGQDLRDMVMTALHTRVDQQVSMNTALQF